MVGSPVCARSGGGEEGGFGVELPEHMHTTSEIDNFTTEVDALIPPVTLDKKLLHMEISTAAIGVGTPSAAHSYTVTSELLRNNSKDHIEIRVDGGSLDPGEMVQGEIVHSGGTALIGNCPFIGPGNSSYSMHVTLIRTGANELTWKQQNINHGSVDPYIDFFSSGTINPIDFSQDWTYQYHMASGSANTTRAQYHLHQVTA